MKTKVTVEGVKGAVDAMTRIAEAAVKTMPKALRDPMRDRVLADAKRLVPKRSGELYDALDVSPVRQVGGRMTDRLMAVGLRIRKRTAGKIGTGTVTKKGGLVSPRRYWHLVEFGTVKTAPHPFLRPAFDANAKHLVDDFKRIMGEGIAREAKRAQRQQRKAYRGGGIARGEQGYGGEE